MIFLVQMVESKWHHGKGKGSIEFWFSERAVDLFVEFLELLLLITEDNFLDFNMPVIMAVWSIFLL